MKVEVAVLVLAAAAAAAALFSNSGALSRWEDELNATEAVVSYVESEMPAPSPLAPKPLMIPLTLIQAAASKGAVCLDGTLPGYHFHRGYGSGANSWLVHLEGGGWCNTIRNCVYRKTTRRGSSAYMEKQLPFTGILSNKAEENPDFFNWNRVKLRYCDGASFNGDSQNEASEKLPLKFFLKAWAFEDTKCGNPDTINCNLQLLPLEIWPP